ncbi:MAG: peptide ABC transporter substrate-binding protein [Deltaproteobacteria bacterium]|nr:MAG: peptide ABC transporter substrate-binding protein [Deltaproteobacteria bacterium]
MRTLAGLFGAFGVALLLVGLTFRASVEAPADLRFVNGAEPRTLDPGVMTGAPEGRIADALFEGLTVRDARTLRPAPGVARRWTLSADRRTYTFELRDDARWTDGRRVTAHDFVYAWRRLLDPQRGAEYAYILYPVRLAEAYHSYAARADALDGPVRRAFERLRAGSPAGVEAQAWRAFLAEHHVHDALAGTADPVLRDALAGRGARLEPDALARIGEALGRAAAHRRARARYAERHFGVDAGVFAPDEETLVVELVAPTPYFLELTAFYPSFPVPRLLVEAPVNAGDWFLPEKIVSNGPFRLERWDVNHRIRLVKSETYWGRDRVALQSVDVYAVENATTALNLYLTGAADWLPGVYPSDLVDVLRERPDFYRGPGLAVYYYRLNTTRPPFDDRRVRQAFALAIDRRSIVEDVLALGQRPATHFVPPGIPGYAPPESGLGFDPERARALLRSAGHPDGRDFPEVGILYNTSESHKKVAEVIADQLRRHLGISVVAYNQEWQAYQATTRALDYDMARAGWIGDYVDPNTFLDLWVTNGGNNQTGWSSPVYDALIRAAADVEGFAAAPEALLRRLREPRAARAGLAEMARARDPRARAAAAARLRMQLFREAEAILVQDEVPILPVYFYVASGLVKPHVGGFYAELEYDDGTRGPNLQDIHPLRAMRLVPGEVRTR